MLPILVFAAFVVSVLIQLDERAAAAKERR